jgi:putative spermidine/putrescine transport system permease protein
MTKKKKCIFEKLILVIFCLGIILPLFTILVWAFTERWAWPSLVPQVLSLRAVRSVFGKSAVLSRVFFSSVMISLVVATLSVLIGAMTARALVCYKFPGKGFFDLLSLLPFLVPSTVFAMGIQITFLKLGMGGTVQGVILVHLICSLPYAVRLLEDGTRAVGTGMEEQARVLGAGPLTAFFKVTFPNLMPVMLSAFSMSYIVSFSQYFLTLIIGGGSVKTFTIVMVPYLQSGERNFASVYSMIFLAITIVIFGVFEWIVNRWTKEQDIEYYA